MHEKKNKIKFRTFLRDQLNTQTYSLPLGHQTLLLSHWLNKHHKKIKDGIVFAKIKWKET